ncbi:MAG TPA: fumarylacetoacetate hydrolase family protein [Bryobacteraceae bacterium]|jgi:2-dehydro-3-deoxy-D-arabinonate dehydratase|nr:fumarylacetoacetate hydrolase family protein [Bryobacteraceae bacterium]
MKLYRKRTGCAVETDGRCFHFPDLDFSAISTRPDIAAVLTGRIGRAEPGDWPNPSELRAPIASQEVWAAGVTYFRSRTARMEESQSAEGGNFYDRVYNAERPELFFKATAHRVAGPGQPVAIRADSTWNVPEPELALLITPTGKITGYTIGNDMSSRSIEGENPLYLPQAKVYDASCALGPCVSITPGPLPSTTRIELSIARSGKIVSSGETSLAEMKRTPEVLVSYLFRHNSFPQGCILLTGTGIVPQDSFTLEPGDEIRITIDGIGTLTNTVQTAN